MSNKNTKCVHIYFERYAETGTTQCLWWHCNTSSLVVVPLMGVETALAALKVSQSPYRGVSEHFTGTRKSISLWRCAMPKVEVP